MKSVKITLTTAGAGTGPFNIYSNVDQFTTPFETNITKSSLVAGYTSTSVPDAATTIRVKSTGTTCAGSYTDLTITGESPSPTTTTTTTTTTYPGGSQCTLYTVTAPEDIIRNYSVEYVNCSGKLVRVSSNQMIAVYNENGTIAYSVCVQNGTPAPVFIQNNQAVEIGYNWQAGGLCSF